MVDFSGRAFQSVTNPFKLFIAAIALRLEQGLSGAETELRTQIWCYLVEWATPRRGYIASSGHGPPFFFIARAWKVWVRAQTRNLQTAVRCGLCSGYHLKPFFGRTHASLLSLPSWPITHHGVDPSTVMAIIHVDERHR
ncbi:hypothetical protein MKZ38_000203 [Zalerion maritima]|uniref:Uncharacterized protein n=1 Tax=Zalerion maritima TaxID=339359 RepID=A0AAD5RFU5_9PEZI|nr:hypothetical protein MKZ38_000203 [Zalerion maritima]